MKNKNQFFPSFFLPYGYVLFSEQQTHFWKSFEYAMGALFFFFLTLSVFKENEIYSAIATTSLFLCDAIPFIILKNNEKIENKKSFLSALSSPAAKKFLYIVFGLSVMASLYDIAIEKEFLSSGVWLLYLSYCFYMFYRYQAR